MVRVQSHPLVLCLVCLHTYVYGIWVGFVYGIWVGFVGWLML